MSLPVSYRVSMSRPHSHLFEVQAHFPPTGDELVATLPVWTPGSYLVREYSRHVQELTATTIDDKPLPMERIDKHTVRVKTGNKPARLHYKVYANELTVRTSHLDGTHGYFNGATLFFYSEALRNREHRVAIHAPKGWNVTTVALESQGMEFRRAELRRAGRLALRDRPAHPDRLHRRGSAARGRPLGRTAARREEARHRLSPASSKPRPRSSAACP